MASPSWSEAIAVGLKDCLPWLFAIIEAKR
jgi:hypothetical protein